MMSTRRRPGPPFLWSLMAPLTVLAFGTGLQTGAPDSSVPTAIEQALIEHRCRTTVAAGAPGTDAYQECPAVQLLSLRTDFGRDLSRLSAAERRSIDAVCSTIRASQGRDAYVDCLSGQLVSLSNRRNRTKPDSSAAAPPPPQEIAPAASPAPPADPGLFILVRPLDWRHADHPGRRGRRRIPGDEDSTFGTHMPSLRDERFRFW